MSRPGAKFQEALDRIAARGKQIDQATAALGIDPTAEAGGDEYLEDEMRQLVGEDGGPTVGSRHRAVLGQFGGGIPGTAGTTTALGDAQAGQPAMATPDRHGDLDFSLE